MAEKGSKSRAVLGGKNKKKSRFAAASASSLSKLAGTVALTALLVEQVNAEQSPQPKELLDEDLPALEGSEVTEEFEEVADQIDQTNCDKKSESVEQVVASHQPRSDESSDACVPSLRANSGASPDGDALAKSTETSLSGESRSLSDLSPSEARIHGKPFFERRHFHFCPQR